MEERSIIENHDPPILLQIMKGEYYERTLEILSMCC